MGISLFKLLGLTVLIVTVITFYSCESKESKEENVTSISTSEEEMSKFSAYLDLALAQNKTWVSHWSNNIGSFDENDFSLILTDSIDPMEMPERNPILVGDPLFPYQLKHPGGNGTMDIYSYKVEASENIEKPFLNPDSEVIWYREDGMKERLLFMGPSGMFEEAMWLNEKEFLVLGYFQNESGFTPMVWLIDVENHILRQFKLNSSIPTYVPESYINQKIKLVDLS
jgi:hypothetical protein